LEPEDPFEGQSVEGNGAREGAGNRKTLSYVDAERRSTTSSQNSLGGNPLPLSRNAGILQSPEQLPSSPQQSDEPKQWNRWLVITQAFTAPFFIVLVIWANTEPESPRALIRPTMYSLIFSLVMLGILISTTSATRPPRWRVLLCFLGFVVSISWISTIAGEVVGVLKSIGVILDMSDAILGLTIFAVGNSLGDLVADITVARLGYPVMALSACFGGPMLNILLGIGLSGCYLTIKGGRHRHENHPDRPYKFKPYHIDVSTTLVISGATLLVTLVGLLVVVPMRKWKMDRKIGWGLVVVWVASTVANVVVELLGWSS
jgi:sodium/potassium/calcium exchanger 6